MQNVVVVVAVSVARIARVAQITAQNVGSPVDIMNDSGYLLCLGLFFGGSMWDVVRPGTRKVACLLYGSQTHM